MTAPQLHDLDTPKFGHIAYRDNQVIDFIEPLLGLETHRRFLCIYQEEAGHYWLQCIDTPHIVLHCIDPFEAGLDYNLEIGSEDAAIIGASQEDEIKVLTTVGIDHDEGLMRTNLRAPVLINLRNKKASQIVHTDRSLPLQYYLGRIEEREALSAQRLAV